MIRGIVYCNNKIAITQTYENNKIFAQNFISDAENFQKFN